MSREVYLVRHAHCERGGTLLGQTDVPLTEEGLTEAERLADWFASRGVERVIASDLKRAAQTARPIGERLGLPVEFDWRLREIAYGDWDGMVWEKIETCDPEAARLWRPPGGESMDTFLTRVHAAWDSICQGAARVTVVVAHRGVNAVLFGDPMGFQQDYASAVRIEIP